MNPDTELVRSNLLKAQELIERTLVSSGEKGRKVKVMAVTKTHPSSVVRMALEAGISLIGENRVSEGGRKIRELGQVAAEFHMIGPIHTGEVRQAVRDFQWIDSVGRLKIASEIARRTVDKGMTRPGLLVEVNTSGEEAKHGFEPEKGLLEDVIGTMLEKGLEVSGLMTVGPLGAGETRIREAFALLRNLRDNLVSSCSISLPELSMGMSDDFQLAVMEGSTTVRLGRYLFGPRS